MAWLIDKSALVRLGASPEAAVWADRIGQGRVRIATVTRLEVGYSARSGPDLRGLLARSPLAAMPIEYLTPAVEDRAVELQLLLADRGHHRAPCHVLTDRATQPPQYLYEPRRGAWPTSPDPGATDN